MPDTIAVPGIEDKRKLLGFFAAKGHHRLVLRVADLRELPLPAQHTLVGLFRTYGELEGGDEDPLQFFSRHSLDGYVVAPFEKLLQAEMRALLELQQVLYLYREVRRGKGEPSRVESCEECRGTGCKKCGGNGLITTFLEMAPEERRLAERGL